MPVSRKIIPSAPGTELAILRAPRVHHVPPIRRSAVKLPSLDELVQTTTRTFARFPLVIFASICLAGITWLFFDEVDAIDPGHLFGPAIGLALFLAIDLYTERKGGKGLRWGLHAVAFAGLVSYSIVAGSAAEQNLAEVYRFGLFVLVAHLLVAISPFIRQGSLDAFWEFNKTLFLRFLLSLLFSAVLFGGIAIAMLAIDQLLLDGNVIEPEAYMKLFVLVGTVFNTVFFLTGVPRDLERLEEPRPYPKGLQVFSQNLLLPLVVLYLGILYVYALSVLVKWEWPKGWIGWLVLSFSVLGILALLLLYPVQKSGRKPWIERFSRWFYLALLPLVAFLFAAIFRRIGEYGFTENRYFVVLLACWLTGIALYFLLRKEKNIKTVPGSLCLVLLFASVGPWGAFSVSAASQASRFIELADEYDVVEKGAINPEAIAKLDEEQKENLRSILRYLGDRDQLTDVEEVIPFGVEPGENHWDLVRRLGLGYGDMGEPNPRQLYFTLNEPATNGLDGQVVDVGEFDLYIPGKGWDVRPGRSEDGVPYLTDSFGYKGRQYAVLYHVDSLETLLVAGSDTLLRFDLKPIVLGELPENNRTWKTGREERMIDAVGNGVRGRLILTSAHGTYLKGLETPMDTSSVRMNYLAWILLLDTDSGGISE